MLSSLKASLYNKQPGLLGQLMSLKALYVMEPALGIRLVCIIPPSLLAIIGTAEILNIRFLILSFLVRSFCTPLWLHSLFLDTQYARKYRGVVALYLFFVHNLILWKGFPMAARVAPVALLLALLWRFLPRERLRPMLYRVL